MANAKYCADENGYWIPYFLKFLFSEEFSRDMIDFVCVEVLRPSQPKWWVGPQTK